MVSEAWHELCGAMIQLRREYSSHSCTATCIITGHPSVTKKGGGRP